MTDSMTINVYGHSFVAYYEWISADDSVGQRAHPELAEIYIDECPDDVSDILSAHVREAIAAKIAERVAAQSQAERYAEFRADREDRCAA